MRTDRCYAADGDLFFAARLMTVPFSSRSKEDEELGEKLRQVLLWRWMFLIADPIKSMKKHRQNRLTSFSSL
jgi:hypothetical protein